MREEGTGNLLSNEESGITSVEEGLGEVSSVGVEVIWVTADALSPNGQRVGNGAFCWMGMAAGEMKVLLEVGGFDMDGGVELTMTHT